MSTLDTTSPAAAELPPAIFLMGPTASGKTDLAMALADTFNAEIISVDSALIYRGMNIGTAKPTAAELVDYPHHLIDICDPLESYSAAEFREDALALMQEVTSRGRLPLLVGGTMQYFKTLLEGLADLPGADPAIRAQIEADAKAHGWPYVHAQLAEVDPASAARIHPNHSQRIERALEVYRITGKTMTILHEQQSEPQPPPYKLLQMAINPEDRAVLHQRIARRFEQMLEQGFIDEVKALRARGDLHPDLPSMRAVGYRQTWQYLEGSLDRAELVERGVVATRQLAKRQLTWLRNWPDLHWINTDESGSKVSGSDPSLSVVDVATGLCRDFLAK